MYNFANGYFAQKMKEFLKIVAEHYKNELKNQDGSMNCLGLSDYLFVFPNRRSSLFFNLYLIEGIDQPFFAPDMTTISELFPKLAVRSKLKLLDRIELLFHLYEVYREVSNSSESFDSFMFWGEMILGDFNDADKYLVDAKLLFRNLKDLKEIEEEFSGLEEEQIRIIRTFWTNFNPESEGHSKKVFRQTWQVMYSIYEQFRARLLNLNAAYEGMQQRILIDELKSMLAELGLEQERQRLTKLIGKKVVFVGLTALSKTEIELMKHLQKLSMAEFCWDYADPRLNDRTSHASYFRTSTIDIFPNIIDDGQLTDGLVTDDERVVEVIEVPSGVGQTVQAANVLHKWVAEGIIDTEEKDKSKSANAFHTAIVLPDEKMLLPMLYSIPKTFEPFNVTMGYSLKSTTIATMIDNIAQLQANIQVNADSTVTFYYKNVLPLLNCNYLLNLTNGKAREIADEIVRNNQYRVKEEALKGNLLLERIFKRCRRGADCASYLRDILNFLAMKAEEELEQQKAEENEESESLFGEIEEAARPQGVFSDVEREFLYSYITLLDSFDEKLTKFGLSISCSTFFTLLHKLAMSQSVAFTGEPLSGLQVMGVLETRGVDFDNLIILSMNEGVFPAKPQTNTFVPMNLRNAFGMPTQQHRDAVFAYHFYRLISRARNVTLIYDSRSEGMQSGEPSRYIKQMSYLYGIKLKYKTVRYDISVENNVPISIRKDKAVMDKLRECLEGGRRKLSASVLKYYINCPLRFYFEFVEGLREDDEIEEGIDDKAFGSILHEAMEAIYETVKGRIVAPEDIDRVLKDSNYIRRVIEQAFREEMKIDDITGYLNLVEEILMTYVRDILIHDKRLGKFHYIEAEKRETIIYPVNNADGSHAFNVRIVSVYDRIDRLENGTLRIVDYKTGRSTQGSSQSKLIVPEISMIFGENSSKCSDEAFQVMLYALLYHEPRVSPNLYFVRDFHKNPDLETELRYEPDGKAPILNFDIYKKEFKKAFDKLILDIFDESKPFTQCDDDKHCRYCLFKEICKR